MKESVVYQEIIEEGRVEEVRLLLLRGGTRKFGPPDEAVRSRLEEIRNLDALEAIMDRMLDGGFKTWAELLPPTT